MALDTASPLPDGLVFAVSLRGKGRATALDTATVDAAWRSEEVAWVHADFRRADGWLREASGLPPGIVEALLSPETRPGLFVEGDGFLVILRALNPNAGEAAEEMVSVRLWVEPTRILSLRARKIGVFHDLRVALDAGKGPPHAAALLAQVVTALSAELHAHVLELEKAVDALAAAEGDLHPVDHERQVRLASARRRVTELSRYVGPQAETLAELAELPRDWLDSDIRWRLRTAATRARRAEDDLVALAAQLTAFEDALERAATERLNRRLYLVAIISTIFLPLSFVASVLGMNVAGAPGTEWPWSFVAVMTLMSAVGMGLMVWFRRARWW